MLTDKELDEGLWRAKRACKFLDKQTIIDEEGIMAQYLKWATAERVLSVIAEVRLWRAMHREARERGSPESWVE